MSFYGGSSSVGGGGFRFTAPSAAVATSTQLQLSTAHGMPPLTIQTLQKSNRPRLQMIAQQVASCKVKAATMTKGSESQKNFNEQYSSLVGMLGTAVKDIEEELFLSLEVQQITNGGKVDPKKVPTSVSIHSLAKDLALYFAGAKEISLGVPYLEMISKSVIASLIEKEATQEKISSTKSKKAESKALLKGVTSHLQPSSTSNPKALSPNMHPNPLIVGGLPSPLQRATNEAVTSFRGAEGQDGPPPLALPSTATANNRVDQQQQQQQQVALQRVLQPWLIPYPFSHGIKTDRVQSVKATFAKSQKEAFAVQAFVAKHPRKAAALAERITNGSTLGESNTHSKGKISPIVAPLNPPQPPNEVMLQHILAHGNLSRQQLYALAPKILEICGCSTASEMLSKWEQREAVFDVLLNAPAVGADSLGQISSVNNPSASAATNVANTNSGAHVALAHRSGELGSQDNSQLYVGSPTLKPSHTPIVKPAHEQSNRGSEGRRNMFEITPLVLASKDPFDENQLAPLTLNDFGPSGAPPAVPSARFFPHKSSVTGKVQQPEVPSIRGSGGFKVVNTATNANSGRGIAPDMSPMSAAQTLGAPAFARASLSPAIAPKRQREDDLPDPRNSFDMSPLSLAMDSAAIALGHHSPQPPKPIDYKGVPGIRNQSSQRLLSPQKEGRGSVPMARPSEKEAPQAFMTVSARVMACLLHFGVVTTELPMVIGPSGEKGGKRVR